VCICCCSPGLEFGGDLLCIGRFCFFICTSSSVCYFCYGGSSQFGGHNHLFAYIGRWLHGAGPVGTVHHCLFIIHLGGFLLFLLLRSTSGGLTICFRCGGIAFQNSFISSSHLLLVCFSYHHHFSFLPFFFFLLPGLVGVEGQIFSKLSWSFGFFGVFIWLYFHCGPCSNTPRGNAHFSTYLTFKSSGFFSGVSMYY